MGLTLREFNALCAPTDLVLSLYPTFTAHKFSLPLPPSVINVTAVEVAMEKALPESEAVPLEL